MGSSPPPFQLHRRYLALSYAAQALGVAVWWALLYAGDPVRGWFVSPDGWDTARTYVGVDLALVAVPSAAVSIAVFRQWCWARSMAIVTEIGVAVGTVEAIRWVAQPVDRWLGAGCMIALLGANEVGRRLLR